MSRGKDASRGLPALLLCLACLGCCNPGRRPAAPPEPPAAPPGPPPLSYAQPGKPLRITGAPTATPSAGAANPLESPPMLSSLPTAPAPRPAPPVAAAAAVPNPPLSPASPPGAVASLATPTPPAVSAVSPLRRLAQRAAASYAPLDGYCARLRQREQVNGKDRPEEVMLVKFRQQPWSVYFKWVGTEGRGREAVYVKGRGDGKIHTRLAAGDVLLMPAGATFAVAPDSFLARGRGRYPITEAGIGTLVEHFGQLVEAAERGERRWGTPVYLGTQTRPEFASPVEAVEQVLPPGAEAALPRGGRRLWFFAADSHLPVLISTRDETGHEVEYYCYDQLRQARFTDEDFNPDRLWARR